MIKLTHFQNNKLNKNMDFKKGDRVKFLNDVGGGIITKMVNKHTAMILAQDGFEIPYALDELMEDNQSGEYSDKKESQIEENESVTIATTGEIYEEEPEYTDSPDVNCYIAFVPENENKIGETDINVYIINDSNYYISYIYATRNDKLDSALGGKLEPNMKTIPIVKLSPADLKEDLHISLQALFFDKKPYTLREPLNKEITIKAARFFKEKSYTENDFFDEKSILIPVLEEDAMKLAMQKLTGGELKGIIKKQESENKSLNTPKKYRKRIVNKIKEVDLHLHELIDNENGLSNTEKLNIQMKNFKDEMNSGIKDKLNKIIFIHGVGNGRLKLEIRKELQRNYKKYNVQDASFKEYGYGATMVILS